MGQTDDRPVANRYSPSKEKASEGILMLSWQYDWSWHQQFLIPNYKEHSQNADNILHRPSQNHPPFTCQSNTWSNGKCDDVSTKGLLSIKILLNSSKLEKVPGGRSR